MEEGKGNLEKAVERGSLILAPESYEDRGALMATKDGFKQAWTVANYLAKSDLVPTHYRGKPENCLLAVLRANKLGVDVQFFMEVSYVVSGKLAFEGKFVIALANGSKKFSPLRWEEGNDPKRGLWAVCYATDLSSGEVLRSVPVSMAMAKTEEWTRNKKWDSMPEQMLRYRSAAFFVRSYAPELMGGLLTTDEAVEIETPRVEKVTALNDEEYPEGQAASQEPAQAEEIIEGKILGKEKEQPAPQDDDGWPPLEEEPASTVQPFKGDPNVAINGAAPSSQGSIFDIPADRRN